MDGETPLERAFARDIVRIDGEVRELHRKFDALEQKMADDMKPVVARQYTQIGSWSVVAFILGAIVTNFKAILAMIAGDHR